MPLFIVELLERLVPPDRPRGIGNGEDIAEIRIGGLVDLVPLEILDSAAPDR